MTDDLRNHDPIPDTEERAWMDSDPVAGISRFVMLAGVAMMVGVACSVLVEQYGTTSFVASAIPAATPAASR